MSKYIPYYNNSPETTHVHDEDHDVTSHKMVVPVNNHYNKICKSFELRTDLLLQVEISFVKHTQTNKRCWALALQNHFMHEQKASNEEISEKATLLQTKFEKHYDPQHTYLADMKPLINSNERFAFLANFKEVPVNGMKVLKPDESKFDHNAMNSDAHIPMFYYHETTACSLIDFNKLWSKMNMAHGVLTFIVNKGAEKDKVPLDGYHWYNLYYYEVYNSNARMTYYRYYVCDPEIGHEQDKNHYILPLGTTHRWLLSAFQINFRILDTTPFLFSLSKMLTNGGWLDALCDSLAPTFPGIPPKDLLFLFTQLWFAPIIPRLLHDSVEEYKIPTLWKILVLIAKNNKDSDTFVVDLIDALTTNYDYFFFAFHNNLKAIIKKAHAASTADIQFLKESIQACNKPTLADVEIPPYMKSYNSKNVGVTEQKRFLACMKLIDPHLPQNDLRETIRKTRDNSGVGLEELYACIWQHSGAAEKKYLFFDAVLNTVPVDFWEYAFVELEDTGMLGGEKTILDLTQISLEASSAV